VLARNCTAPLIVLVADCVSCRCAHSTAQCCRIEYVLQYSTVQCGAMQSVGRHVQLIWSPWHIKGILFEPRVQTHTELMMLFVCELSLWAAVHLFIPCCSVYVCLMRVPHVIRYDIHTPLQCQCMQGGMRLLDCHRRLYHTQGCCVALLEFTLRNGL
jgi:hypothetical protein